MTTALFVGRFQPFHLGHMQAVKEILRENDKVVIAIGSSQEAGTEKNPFSFKERKRMVEEALWAEDIQEFRIIGVQDFMDDEKWASAIMEQARFDKVYTRNPWTARCFTKKGIEVRKHKVYNRGSFRSTEIRRRISKGEEWERLVSKKVAEIIKGNKGKLAANHMK
jgi:nicotinamide-nucleotide adenylyltransferase